MKRKILSLLLACLLIVLPLAGCSEKAADGSGSADSLPSSSGGVTDANAGTSDEEIGWDGVGKPVYPPARKKLAEHGLNCEGKRARQITRADYGRWDLLLGMEEMNLSHMKRVFGGDPEGKIRRLLDYAERPRDISDPWFSGDFDAAWLDIAEGCAALFDALTKGEFA